MENEEYRELGGWLKFYFIVSFIAIALILWQGVRGAMGWFNIMDLHLFDNKKIVVMLITLFLNIVALTITRTLIIMAIIKRKPASSIRKVIVIEMIINLATTIYIYWLMYSISGSKIVINQSILKSIISIIVPSVIWYIYFQNSVRVAVYTGENDDDMSNEMKENTTTETPLGILYKYRAEFKKFSSVFALVFQDL